MSHSQAVVLDLILQLVAILLIIALNAGVREARRQGIDLADLLPLRRHDSQEQEQETGNEIRDKSE